jgi:hypothetical protein
LSAQAFHSGIDFLPLAVHNKQIPNIREESIKKAGFIEG